MGSEKKFYAVAAGRKPGIYTAWFGDSGAFVQVNKYPKARFKGFSTYDEAKAFIDEYNESGNAVQSEGGRKTEKKKKKSDASGGYAGSVSGASPDNAVFNGTDENTAVVFTDGACLGNPGPGGYGVVFPKSGGEAVELSDGFRLTTNNRMELLACIEGLKLFGPGSAVKLFTDSRYVVDGITKGWAKNWRKKNWMRTPTEPAKNADLWEKLLVLCEERRVGFHWVKGHAGNELNERCDKIAREAAEGERLKPDEAFENKSS